MFYKTPTFRMYSKYKTHARVLENYSYGSTMLRHQTIHPTRNETYFSCNKKCLFSNSQKNFKLERVVFSRSWRATRTNINFHKPRAVLPHLKFYWWFLVALTLPWGSAIKWKGPIHSFIYLVTKVSFILLFYRVL